MVQEKYKVCVRCFTYNQANYIEDTLNGFCIQETNFPYVCVIMDDSSTDGEQGVIRDYVDRNFCHSDDKYRREVETDDYVLTLARHKTNKNCFFAVFYLKYNHYGKKSKEPYFSIVENKVDYIAMCEGDDYWTDSQKLQKQAYVLDNNPKCALVYTNAYLLKNNRLNKIHGDKTNFDKLLMQNTIITATTMYRLEAFRLYIEDVCPFSRNWKMGDYPLWLYLAYNNDIIMLEDFTSVYRVLQTSASHFSQGDVRRDRIFSLSAHEIRSFYCDKYNLHRYKKVLKMMRAQTLLRCKLMSKMDIGEEVTILRNLHPIRFKDLLIYFIVHLYPFPISYKILYFMIKKFWRK